MSQDLPDGDATDIVQNNLLPNFRREDYYEGLKETVVAITRRVGNESWEERLQVRQQKGHGAHAWLIAALVAALGISVGVVVVIYRPRKT